MPRANAAARGVPPIQVGAGARHDVLLARASLAASGLLYRLAQTPEARKNALLRKELRRYGVGAFETFQREFRALARTRSSSQAIYDALRLIIANAFAEEFMLKLTHASVLTRDASVLGMIDMNNTERSVACGITAGTTLLTGLVASIYGGAGGAQAAGTGGAIAGQTFGCNKAEQEAAMAMAASQAQAAEVQANAAIQVAQAQERMSKAASEARTKQVTTMAVVGGGLLLLVVAGYAIVKA